LGVSESNGAEKEGQEEYLNKQMVRISQICGEKTIHVENREAQRAPSWMNSKAHPHPAGSQGREGPENRSCGRRQQRAAETKVSVEGPLHKPILQN
jgi:hypothetical protein